MTGWMMVFKIRKERMEARFEAYLANTNKEYDGILPSNGWMSNKGSGPEDSSTKGYHRIVPMVETTKHRKKNVG